MKSSQKLTLSMAITFFLACTPNAHAKLGAKSDTYLQMQEDMQKGWNTWNNSSMLCHVLLPECLGINLVIKKAGHSCTEARMGTATLRPGPHSYDGSYTEIEIEWHGYRGLFQTAVVNGDWVALMTPVSGVGTDTYFEPVFEMLWDKEGSITNEGTRIKADLPTQTISVYATYPSISSVQLGKDPVGISTGVSRTVTEITDLINHAKATFKASKDRFNGDRDLSDAYDAMQTALAWNIIYDWQNDRVITPVSRDWNVNWRGWILFEWDTYFAAYMMSMDSKELAYANAVEMTKHITEASFGNGTFVPNLACAAWPWTTTRDRSEPPVGSLLVWEIYRHYKEAWFLEDVYDELLAWNRWWPEYRDDNGYLCWGSNAGDDQYANSLTGVRYESGLDNSPMYDRATFNETTHLMELADVGLMSLYIADCKRLAKIADVLGHTDDKTELTARAETYQTRLQTLWNSRAGIYQNRNMKNGELSDRVSPTNLYPLLGSAATQEQADTIMKNYFYNTKKFWGTYLLPSITRDDSHFNGQGGYWRGPIWGPMNFLVYLGMRNYDIPRAQADLASKSMSLLLQEWREERHVHENYCSVTGDPEAGVGHSAPFYHWGGLLGIIPLIEAGYMLAPDTDTPPGTISTPTPAP